MTGSSTWAAVRADAARYRDRGGCLKSLGFWVGFSHRAGSWIAGIRPAPLRFALAAGHRATVLTLQLCRNLEIPRTAPIGSGLCLPNPYGIVMPSAVEIGSGCTIYQGVTLGLGPLPGCPRLGNNVRLMPGSRILGGVTLGDGVEVGANAVVTQDLPAGTLFASPAARTHARTRG
jgi:serine O-acetyltransferase